MSRKPSHTPGQLLWKNVRRLAPKVLRLGAFIAFLHVGLLFGLAMYARAQVGEVLMGLGAEMLRYEDVERQDAPRLMLLNGERLHFATGLTDHEVSDVLDFYQGRCREVSSFAEEIEMLRDGALETAEGTDGILDGVLRTDEGDRGLVACLDGGQQSESLRDKFRRFEQSLDLSDVGDLRYVYVQRGDDKTFFAAFWTEGSFAIGRMFPETGDAPGFDPEDVPRPDGARRLLSAREEGEPYEMVIYADSPKSSEELEQHYRTIMPEEGWSILEPSQESLGSFRIPDDANRLLVLERRQELVAMVFGDEESGGTATVLVGP